jgi:CYTH domain-containing protein
MAIEIERKFLVKTDEWIKAREHATCTPYKQGYLQATPNCTVRVRQAGEKGFLTIKGKTDGMSRLEFEYEIPLNDLNGLLPLCSGPLVEKYRCTIMYKNKLWEVDEFLGDNEGLIIAEIELDSPIEEFELPQWIEKEVTGDKRYYNSFLSANPYKKW